MGPGSALYFVLISTGWGILLRFTDFRDRPIDFQREEMFSVFTRSVSVFDVSDIPHDLFFCFHQVSECV